MNGLLTEVRVAMTLNGAAVEWMVEPGEVLLDALRRHGWFGVKRGCDSGDCGACTVLLNGQPVNSCQVFAAQVDGCDLLTIEGVAQGDALDPLQEAFLDHGGVQCGFCTPGMILTARWLLREKPDPSEQDVREALRGNLCRCTGYKKIVEAVLAVAASNQGMPRQGMPGFEMERQVRP
jgi:aerobic carbon-monoxide dehydrogenase small subunit